MFHSTFKHECSLSLVPLELSRLTNAYYPYCLVDCANRISVVQARTMENLRCQIINTHEVTVTNNKELLLLSTAMSNSAGCYPQLEIETGNKRRRVPVGIKPWKNHETTVSFYSGPFGRVRVTKEVDNSRFEADSSARACTRSKTTWIFMSSFLSRHIDMQYLNTGGHVQRSIRTYPVLPYEHPVWKMCHDGDLKGIQKLLGDRQVSPFSVDAVGDTLLHVGSR